MLVDPRHSPFMLKIESSGSFILGMSFDTFDNFFLDVDVAFG